MRQQEDVVELEELDVEEFSKGGDERKPPARVYIIRVDKQRVRVEQAVASGSEILALVAKDPTTHKLIQKCRSGERITIAPDDEVDLRAPGVERFHTIPLDTTEGLDSLRREFDLPDFDVAFLEGRGLPWETVVEGTTRWLFVHDYPVPDAYGVERVSLALDIPPSYSDTQLDMVYVLPHLALARATPIRQLAERTIEGVQWQRWSRHRTGANPWRRGYDCVETHLLLVDEWLEREVRKAA